MTNWVIIVAGGSGTRFSSIIPKQYMLLENKEIILWTIGVFLTSSNIDKILVVIRPEDEHFFLKMNLSDKIYYTFGGSERSESVLNGINYIGSCDYVLIHDAVRPVITTKLIDDLFIKIKSGNYDGVLPLLKINEAVKSLINGKIESVDRTNLYISQTPQIFKYNSIRECFQKNLHIEHDEIGFLKDYNISYIEGNRNNIKITNYEDFIQLSTAWPTQN